MSVGGIHEIYFVFFISSIELHGSFNVNEVLICYVIVNVMS